MIRIPYNDGYLLIPQPAHAWLSGQLARQWGGDVADSPEPLEAIVLATTLHDVGWLAKDTRPLLNDAGQPLNFLEPGIDDVEDMYLRAVDHVTAVDPYAGLLVNRHVQLIFEGRVKRGTDTLERMAGTLAQLQTGREALVQQMASHPIYREHLSDVTVTHNYRILRTCDLLSLFLCGALPPRTMPDVPTRYGESSVELACQLKHADALHISAALFEQDELKFYVDARYIEQAQFASATEYEQAFTAAEQITLRKTLITT